MSKIVIASIWLQNMQGYLYLDITCFWKITLFSTLLLKTRSLQLEQIMSMEKKICAYLPHDEGKLEIYLDFVVIRIASLKLSFKFHNGLATVLL